MDILAGMPAALVRLHRIEKSFPGVHALKSVSLEILPGEIHGIVGENGAGKSTLIRILSGVLEPDSGQIYWLDRPVRFSSAAYAQQLGIATIHQELAYFAHLSVAENLLMGQPWPRYWWGGMNWKLLHAHARAQLERFHLTIPTTQLFMNLSAAEKQEVALARTLGQQSRLLILDEPSASLTQPEVDRLFQHLERLQNNGVSALYISHRLDEIQRLADRITVMRDGAVIATHLNEGVDLETLIHEMVGRRIEQVYPRSRTQRAGTVLLEVRGLTRSGMFSEISFKIRSGEIVGLSGLVGAGRSELSRCLYGLYPPERGEVYLADQPIHGRKTEEVLELGLIYLPEERKRHGLVMDQSIATNLSIGFSDPLARTGWISKRKERQRVTEALQRYDIRALSSEQIVSTLSGGNQQKILLGRWLEREPRVLILDEPTRGVDIAAKADIHARIDALAGAGKAILLISSDLPELLAMSDRILVMYQGRLVAELSHQEATRDSVLRAASGLTVRSAASPEAGL